jgi:dTDP-4-dehydrorhamnose reductase
MMRRAFVLGHEGMLGHVVSRWLSENGWHVSTSSSRYVPEVASTLLDEVVASSCDAVVNCIGTTTGRAESAQLFAANALLPQHLAARLGPNRLLVHASTDGVFTGDRAPYRATDRPDALDPYGLSKRLGELAIEFGSVVVLRSSIVGPDRLEPRSLMSWLLSRQGEVTGYTDHVWNGITTLEWARLCAAACEGRLAPGLHQPACASPVSKYELLRIMTDVYEREVSVMRGQSGHPIDRTLIPTKPCPAIRDQLRDLRRWYRG